MRLMIVASLALMLLAPASGQEPPPVRRFTVPSHVPSVVAIYATDGDRCSGWVVGANLVMTAGHCVGWPHERFLVTFEDGSPEAMFTTLKSIHAGQGTPIDMALLYGPTHGLPVLSIAEESQIPTSIWCTFIGYGGAVTPVIQQTTVCRTMAEKSEEGFLQLHGRAVFGDSGGPVLDNEGNVIGMVKSIDGRGRPFAYAVPASLLRQFVEAAR